MAARKSTHILSGGSQGETTLFRIFFCRTETVQSLFHIQYKCTHLRLQRSVFLRTWQYYFRCCSFCELSIFAFNEARECLLNAAVLFWFSLISILCIFFQQISSYWSKYSPSLPSYYQFNGFRTHYLQSILSVRNVSKSIIFEMYRNSIFWFLWYL